MVDGLEVERISEKPECEPCTKAKLHLNPFPGQAEHQATKNGQRTHMDIWGKMAITSLEGYQYFVAFIDNKA